MIYSEYFDALDIDLIHHLFIFTLVILLCSYFLYYSIADIEERALYKSNFFINVSKLQLAKKLSRIKN